MLIVSSLQSGQSTNKLYFNNPNFYSAKASTVDEIALDSYHFNVVNDKLQITSDNTQFTIDLPTTFVKLKSIQLSYDHQYVAYDLEVTNGTKIYVVNLLTGEHTNVSDTVGYVYDYSGYEVPYGIAWSPTENILAFVGGYDGSTRVNIFHFEHDGSMQSKNGSLAYQRELRGVKWAKDGSSIYFLVESGVAADKNTLYQTSIEITDGYMYGDTIEKIKELDQEESDAWLKN
ncbi:hypothetical protein [Radiobacillus sp. PE A8.2]|uniref:hypothetical protein n=1 Tax=Radiobacillus sp. PE A8.2 TaxID=3380349 RepID=UPI00389025BE